MLLAFLLTTVALAASPQARGQMTDLGSLGVGAGTSYSSAAAINDSGQVVGRSEVFDASGNYTGTHAFITGAAGTNHAPSALAATYETAEDTALDITLSASDEEGDALSYSVVSQPSHGTLSGTAPNLTYTPAANYNGPDSFSFKANDGTADSNTATVSISVNSVNDDAPVAENDSAKGVRKGSTTINVLANDSDPDGDPLTIVSFTQGSKGTVAFVGGGTTGTAFTYTRNARATGTLADSFKYTISDGNSGTATATVTITAK
jgi:hypothetical protein